jgi:hypothetical protein
MLCYIMGYAIYCHVSGVPWLIITDSELDDLIYWHFYYNYSQLQSLVTAHNLWLPKTRSIPYWTTSVFSSTMTDLILVYESVNSSASVARWLTLRSWKLIFCILFYCDWRLTTDLHDVCLTNAFCDWITCPFITWCGPEIEHSPVRFVCCNPRISCHGNVC